MAPIFMRRRKLARRACDRSSSPTQAPNQVGFGNSGDGNSAAYEQCMGNECLTLHGRGIRGPEIELLSNSKSILLSLFRIVVTQPVPG
jgi:hypothetical protein